MMLKNPFKEINFSECRSHEIVVSIGYLRLHEIIDQLLTTSK